MLLRRTRLALLAAGDLTDAESVMPVARAMGAELGWDHAQVRAAAEAWPDELAAEGANAAAAQARR